MQYKNKATVTAVTSFLEKYMKLYSINYPKLLRAYHANAYYRTASHVTGTVKFALQRTDRQRGSVRIFVYVDQPIANWMATQMYIYMADVHCSLNIFRQSQFCRMTFWLSRKPRDLRRTLRRGVSLTVTLFDTFWQDAVDAAYI